MHAEHLKLFFLPFLLAGKHIFKMCSQSELLLQNVKILLNRGAYHLQHVEECGPEADLCDDRGKRDQEREEQSEVQRFFVLFGGGGVWGINLAKQLKFKGFLLYRDGIPRNSLPLSLPKKFKGILPLYN